MTGPIKPDFHLVGAPRCGTTAMSQYLAMNPSVFMVPVKGTHFFAPDLAFLDRREPGGDPFRPFMEGAGQGRIKGETSVWHVYSERAPALMNDFNPAVKVIIMIRDPVDMVHSLHARMVLDGLETIEDFSEALAMEAKRKEAVIAAGAAFGPLLYTEAARLSGRVRRYLEVLGPERVRVIVHDDLRDFPERTYVETCEFLGADPTHRPAFKVVNPNRKVRSRLLEKALKRTPRSVIRAKRKLMPGSASIGGTLERMNKKEVARASIGRELETSLSETFAEEVGLMSELLKRDLTGWVARTY